MFFDFRLKMPGLSTICLIILFVGVKGNSKAQFFTMEVGGAGLAKPTIGYEQWIYDDFSDPYSNATRFKIAVGYYDMVLADSPMLKFGMGAVWGHKNNWEAGVDIGLLEEREEGGTETSGFAYGYFGYRFGGPQLQGVFNIGPFVFPGIFGSGPLVVPMASLQFSYRLFQYPSARK